MSECNLKLKQVNLLSRLDNIVSIFLESETFVETPSEIQISLYDIDNEKITDFITIGLFQGLTEVIFFDISDIYDGFKKVCRFDVRLYRQVCIGQNTSGINDSGAGSYYGSDYQDCIDCISNWDPANCINLSFDDVDDNAPGLVPGGGCTIDDGKLPSGMSQFPYSSPNITANVGMSKDITIELDIQKPIDLNPPFPPPRGGGDQHLSWGVDNSLNLLYAPFVTDDNYTMSEIDPCTQVEVFDHYQILWAEKHQDNSWGFIYAKMHQVCRWPGGPIVKSISSIGDVEGAIIHSMSSPLKDDGDCGCCKLNTTWSFFKIDINWDKLETLSEYGGIGWELYKYIGSVSIPSTGFTGPMGANTSFWNSSIFRTTQQSIDETALISLVNGNLSIHDQSFTDSLYDNLAAKYQYLNSTTLNLQAEINTRFGNVPPVHDCASCDGESEPADCKCKQGDPSYPPYGASEECTTTTTNPPDYAYACFKNGFDEQGEQLYICKLIEPGDDPEQYTGFYLNDSTCNGDCPTAPPTTAPPTSVSPTTAPPTSVPPTTISPPSSTTTTTSSPLEAQPQSILDSYVYNREKNKWIKSENLNNIVKTMSSPFPLNGYTRIKFKALESDNNMTVYDATEITGAGASILTPSDLKGYITKATVNNLNKNYFTINSTNPNMNIFFNIDIPLRYRGFYNDFTVVEDTTEYDAYHYSIGLSSMSLLNGQTSCDTSQGFGLNGAVKIGTAKFTPGTSCRNPLPVSCNDIVCPMRPDIPLIKINSDYCGNNVDIDVHCDGTIKPTDEKFTLNRFVLFYTKSKDVVPVIKGYIHDTNVLPDGFRYSITLQGSTDKLREYVCKYIKFASVKNYSTMYSDPEGSVEFNWPFNDLYWFASECPPSIPGDPSDPNNQDPNDPNNPGNPNTTTTTTAGPHNPGDPDPDPNPPNDPNNPLTPPMDNPVGLVPC